MSEKPRAWSVLVLATRGRVFLGAVKSVETPNLFVSLVLKNARALKRPDGSVGFRVVGWYHGRFVLSQTTGRGRRDFTETPNGWRLVS